MISKDEGKFVYAILSSRWIEIKKNFILMLGLSTLKQAVIL